MFAASGGALLFDEGANETRKTRERQGECDDMDGNPVASGGKQAILHSVLCNRANVVRSS